MCASEMKLHWQAAAAFDLYSASGSLTPCQILVLALPGGSESLHSDSSLLLLKGVLPLPGSIRGPGRCARSSSSSRPLPGQQGVSLMALGKRVLSRVLTVSP